MKTRLYNNRYRDTEKHELLGGMRMTYSDLRKILTSVENQNMSVKISIHTTTRVVTEKWRQPVIHSFEINSIVFRGTEQECINWLGENDSRGVCEIYQL